MKEIKIHPTTTSNLGSRDKTVKDITVWVCDTCGTMAQTGALESSLCIQCGEPMKAVNFARQRQPAHRFEARYLPHLVRVDVKIDPPIGMISGFSISMIGPATANLLLKMIAQANGEQ